MPVPVVDVFAGPGGLNEGFSQFNTGMGTPFFQSRLAAEMDTNAVATLRLRKFYRLCLQKNNMQRYREYLLTEKPKTPKFEQDEDWLTSQSEVAHVELGQEESNNQFDQLLSKALKGQNTWVLLGGPPCQAYSNIRRWTFKTDEGYDLSGDHRAHLYKEYLRIIESFGPSVFVMENVKGVLSSGFFEKIINDLETVRYKGFSYNIFSLSVPATEIMSPSDFLVKAEEYGIPQSRHRIILLGVRSDIKKTPGIIPKIKNKSNVIEAIGDLPPLRSGFSKQGNSDEDWYEYVASTVTELCNQLKQSPIPIKYLAQSSCEFMKPDYDSPLLEFIYRNHLGFITNHETRGHIAEDIKRYAYCALYGQTFQTSPKTYDFPTHLVPKHKNWSSGKFNDRFRLQLKHLPSTTITSHISKDGHGYIHYDPSQARSLTVREAARLQTFPDNYHFEGPRTAQYKQVGNAVPPYLAYKIAKVIRDLLA